MSNLRFNKFPENQGCTGAGFNQTPKNAFRKDECGFARFNTTEVPNAAHIDVKFFGPDGELFQTLVAENTANNQWDFDILPTDNWPSGEMPISIVYNDAEIGSGLLLMNYLEATLEVDQSGAPYQTGDAVPVEGEIYEIRTLAPPPPTDPPGRDEKTPVPAQFYLRAVQGPLAGEAWGPFQASDNGHFQEDLPAEATEGIGGKPGSEVPITIQVFDSSYDDPDTGAWGAKVSGAVDLTMTVFEPRCPGFKKVTGNHIIGTNNVDFIRGTSKRDIICGGAKGDRLLGMRGNDILIGGGGRDFLGGSGGRDKLKGNAGNDTLAGRGGRDKLFGGKDDDFLQGGPDIDTCHGGPGNNEKKSCE